jgi:hypothetical protein
MPENLIRSCFINVKERVEDSIDVQQKYGRDNFNPFNWTRPGA